MEANLSFVDDCSTKNITYLIRNKLNYAYPKWDVTRVSTINP